MPPWREPEIGTDVTRPSEAARVVDGGQEGECGDRAYAGHAHQPAQGHVGAHYTPDRAVEGGDLRRDVPPHLSQARQERSKQRMPFGQGFGAPDEGLRAPGTDDQAERLEHAPDLSIELDADFRLPTSAAP